jgi:hypothetical protein
MRLYTRAMVTRWWLLPLSVWLLLVGITLSWWELDSVEEEHRIFWFAVLAPVFALLVVKLASKVALRCLAFAARRKAKTANLRNAPKNV